MVTVARPVQAGVVRYLATRSAILQVPARLGATRRPLRIAHGPVSDHVRLPRDAGGTMSRVSGVRDPRATVRREVRPVGRGPSVVAVGALDGVEAGRGVEVTLNCMSLAEGRAPSVHVRGPDVQVHEAPEGCAVAVYDAMSPAAALHDADTPPSGKLTSAPLSERRRMLPEPSATVVGPV